MTYLLIDHTNELCMLLHQRFAALRGEKRCGFWLTRTNDGKRMPNFYVLHKRWHYDEEQTLLHTQPSQLRLLLLPSLRG